MSTPWSVRIRYNNPDPAGPIVGTVNSTDGWITPGRECPKRGESIRGMFGMATVTSIKRLKKEPVE